MRYVLRGNTVKMKWNLHASIWYLTSIRQLHCRKNPAHIIRRIQNILKIHLNYLLRMFTDGFTGSKKSCSQIVIHFITFLVKHAAFNFICLTLKNVFSNSAEQIFTLKKSPCFQWEFSNLRKEYFPEKTQNSFQQWFRRVLSMLASCNRPYRFLRRFDRLEHE